MLNPNLFLASHDLFGRDRAFHHGRIVLSRRRRLNLLILLRGIHTRSISKQTKRDGPRKNSLMSLTLATALVLYSDIDTRYQPVIAKT